MERETQNGAPKQAGETVLSTDNSYQKIKKPKKRKKKRRTASVWVKWSSRNISALSLLHKGHKSVIKTSRSFIVRASSRCHSCRGSVTSTDSRRCTRTHRRSQIHPRLYWRFTLENICICLCIPPMFVYKHVVRYVCLMFIWMYTSPFFFFRELSLNSHTYTHNTASQ